jgi:hypothetical protein
MSYDVFGKRDGIGPDHAFLVITDNASGRRWIVRGGPNQQNAAGFVSGALSGDLKVVGEVRPLERSTEATVLRERDKSVTRHFRSFLPDVSGEDLAARAGQVIDEANTAGRSYGLFQDSNSIAGEVYQELSGRKLTGSELWGVETRLRDETPTDEWMRTRTREARLRNLPAR